MTIDKKRLKEASKINDWLRENYSVTIGSLIDMFLSEDAEKMKKTVELLKAKKMLKDGVQAKVS